MQTRPTLRPAQTLKQAKADFKKHGPRISSQEARQFKRSAELWERAEKIKEKEQKRKEAAKKRQDKELREREARRRMGMLSQQPPAISQRQVLLVGFLSKDSDGGGERTPHARDTDISKEVSEESDEACGRALAGSGGEGTNLADNRQETTMPQHRDEDPWDDDVDDHSLLETFEPAAAPGPAFLSSSALRASTPSSGSQCTQSRTSDRANSTRSPDTDVALEEAWEDFLASNTQIQREITPLPARFHKRPCRTELKRHAIKPLLSPDLPFLSTQDVNLDDHDVEELGLDTSSGSIETESSKCDQRAGPTTRTRETRRPAAMLMPPPPRPFPHKPAAQSRLSFFETKANSPVPRSEDSAKANDRIMMPPPLKPTPKHRPFAPSCSKQIVSFQAQPTSSLLDFLPTDFELSTQDCREIEV